MANRRKIKYPGKLGQRPTPPKKNDDPFSEKHRSESREISDLLFQYYKIQEKVFGIDDSLIRWKALALALAKDYVPAFQPIKRVGRPKKWDEGKQIKLICDVKILTRKGKTERSACHHLAGKESWKSFVESKSEKRESIRGTLLRIYKELKKEEHQMFTDINMAEKAWPDDIDEMLQYISDKY